MVLTVKPIRVGISLYLLVPKDLADLLEISTLDELIVTVSSNRLSYEKPSDEDLGKQE